MGGITSERWAASDWNRWATYVGIRNADRLYPRSEGAEEVDEAGKLAILGAALIEHHVMDRFEVFLGEGVQLTKQFIGRLDGKLYE